MRKNSAGKTGGFTLLEVLIAITLTGLVIAVLANSLSQSSNARRLLADRVTANILGQGKLAEVVYGGDTGLSGDFGTLYPRFKWSATEESMDDGGKKITLTVEWRDNRAFTRQTVFIGYSLPE